jgi:DNA-binding LacI/PurR family transcriptional regulator
MAVTLKDIAREVGLSVPTVSEVLRNDPNSRLASDTRERVLRTARELGYSHNIYARALSTGKSRLIGLLMDNLMIEIGLSKLRALDVMIRSKDYGTEMRITEGLPENQAKVLAEFSGRMAEGIVAVQGLFRSSYDSVLSLINHGIPVVSIEQVAGLDIDCVAVDRFHGAYIATKHLIESGHTRIGMVHGSPMVSIQGKIEGYKQALEESGIQVDEKLMTPFNGSGSPKDGYDAMKTLLSRKAGLTAVFCNNDQLAFGAMRAILDEGLRIPEDVAVVGFDNITLSAYAPVPLTTVQQPVEEIARLATDLLFQQIDGTKEAVARQTISVKPSLIVRQSSIIR